MSEQQYAHYTDVVQAMNGYVHGTMVKAVCGKEFVPSNDPQKFPVCPECQSLYDIKKALEELTKSGLLSEGFVLGIRKATNEQAL